ncbi:MAG: hypothetical protein ACI9MC_002732 [Kiritimatiellia bacterium]|jgi:hypothetical protein
MSHGTLTLALCISATLWTGCYQDIALNKNAVCDGQKQGDEDTVNFTFDRDGDGYFDAANPDCLGTYRPAVLDCHDGDDNVNPASIEQTCNNVVDDSNPDTPDALDADGSNSCEDCNDRELLPIPNIPEQCDHDLDNDCDGEANEESCPARSAGPTRR